MINLFLEIFELKIIIMIKIIHCQIFENRNISCLKKFFGYASVYKRKLGKGNSKYKTFFKMYFEIINNEIDVIN